MWLFQKTTTGVFVQIGDFRQWASNSSDDVLGHLVSGTWLRAYSSGHLPPGIWLWAYVSGHMDLGIWLRAFGARHMAPGVRKKQCVCSLWLPTMYTWVTKRCPSLCVHVVWRTGMCIDVYFRWSCYEDIASAPSAGKLAVKRGHVHRFNRCSFLKTCSGAEPRRPGEAK